MESHRSLVFVAHLIVPRIISLEPKSRLHVRANKAVGKGVQVTIVVRDAWIVNSVCSHVQSLDTSEFIVVDIGRKQVALSRMDAIVEGDDRTRAVGVNMQRSVIAMHVETNRDSDSFERGDLRHDGICSEPTVGRHRNIRQMNVDGFE